ncbi:protein kinase domain-containing protein [Helicobacter sp. 23-1044]
MNFKDKSPSQENLDSAKIKPFMIGVQITDISNEILPTHFIPKVGDYVMTPSGTQIKLTNKIAEGGEGTAFETSTEHIAKIYFAQKITKRIYEKIKLMITRQVKFKGICFPSEILLNKHNEFVGFLMPKAKGHNLQRIMFSKPLLEKYFPKFKKRDMIELCITILEKITFLHSLNVILGDINPQNILVVSPKEIYFVDTDSYQIGGFPCPVGTINFTAPEIQGKNYATFLRTIGNDKFAVATLLFMIMLPGKPPYSQQGGESPTKNIQNGNFPYAFDGSSNEKAPEGSWKFMWSHLDYKLKESFYHTFQKGGKYNDKNNRISAKKWLKLFENYRNNLNNMIEIDEMSNDIFPSRYKKIKNREYIKCRICNKETDKKRTY